MAHSSAVRLAESDLDAVVLALPPYYYPDTLAAIAAYGRHIYCEKPLAIDVPGALAVIDVSRQTRGEGRVPRRTSGAVGRRRSVS